MEIEVALNDRLKSFASNVDSTKLNPFTILLGRNGAGKTQLLRLLKGSYYDTRQPEGQTTIKVDGETIASHDVVLIEEWGMPSANPAGINELLSVSNELQAIIQNGATNPSNWPTEHGFFSYSQLQEIKHVTQQLRDRGFDWIKKFPDMDEDIFPLLSTDFNSSGARILNERIGEIIFAKHLDAKDRMQVLPNDEDPINVFNQLCKDFELDFELAPFTTIKRSYSPLLLDSSKNPIDWSDLSAGEKVLFRIICWLFYYENNTSLYPKLILMDEPDAHLSPAMIRKFLRAVEEIIVGKMNIRIIMTTHSPNTIALSTESSLFELKRLGNNHRIDRISKHDALNIFSEGLVFVQEQTRLIFIEGQDDTGFYTSQYEMAVARFNLPNRPSMKFIPVSIRNPDAGGCQQVIDTVERFADTSIRQLVHGLIDRDVSNAPTGNIQTLNRYAIENYIYDPLVVLITLVKSGRHKDLIPQIRHIDTGAFEEILSNPSLLQTSIDRVIELTLQGSKSTLDTTPVPVSVRTRIIREVIQYTIPKWLIDISKTDLNTTLYKSDHPLRQIIQRPSNQINSMDLVSLLFVDIEDIFKHFQK
jgi:ABC-type branched-subunit amino acid transport system ATPase component